MERHTLNVSLIKQSVVEYLEMQEPGPSTSFHEIKRFSERYLMENQERSPFDRLHTDIPEIRMLGILTELKRKAIIGSAIVPTSTWGEHYYLVSYRKQNPEIAKDWLYSEYRKGVKISSEFQKP